MKRYKNIVRSFPRHIAHHNSSYRQTNSRQQDSRHLLTTTCHLSSRQFPETRDHLDPKTNRFLRFHKNIKLLPRESKVLRTTPNNEELKTRM